MINHVTYHLTPEGLAEVHEVMKLIGYSEVEPDDPFEHGYNVRWFRKPSELTPLVHFVSNGARVLTDRLELGHFCVVVPQARFDKAADSPFCTRNSGSGRVWLCHDRVRIEVRPVRHNVEEAS